MSFSLVAAGRKEEVRKQLHQQLEDHKRWGVTDQEKAVAKLLEEHLDASKFAGGLFLEASGHQDAGFASLTITLRMLAMPVLVDPPAELDGDNQAEA